MKINSKVVIETRLKGFLLDINGKYGRTRRQLVRGQFVDIF